MMSEEKRWRAEPLSDIGRRVAFAIGGAPEIIRKYDELAKQANKELDAAEAREEALKSALHLADRVNAVERLAFESIKEELAARRASDQDVRTVAELVVKHQPYSAHIPSAINLLAATWLKKEGE